MACRNKRKALKVLMGELGPEASSRMLEHCRVCGECREAFDFAAATISKTAGAAGVFANTDSAIRGIVPPPGVRRREAWPEAFRHRNRRTLFVFVIVALALLLAGVTRRSETPPGEPCEEVFWKRSLSQGTPIIHAPSGSFETRPRVITALVPPGAGTFSVTVIDQSGRAIWQHQEKPGERGCFVEEAEIAVPSGAFRAGKLLVPFPDDIKLDPGQSYGVVVAVAGGHASASSAFQIAPAGGELHGAAPEAR